MPHSFSLAFRPLQSCNFCRDVKEVPIVSNISPDEFERRFAYSSAPVIVKDATQNWTATEVFTYDYFRDLYLDAFEFSNKASCQFFPYKTEFKSLQDAFRMDEARARYEKGQKPWYFGWSNCDQEIGQELRKHYGRPYFLPKLSENNAVDWIFMGGSGFGAHMHVSLRVTKILFESKKNFLTGRQRPTPFLASANQRDERMGSGTSTRMLL